MTQITRIDTDLLYFIRDDPCHQRHPRSIDAIFAANTNCWTVYAIDNRSNKLAVLLKKQGKYEEADASFLRALVIFEAALGAGHPKVASCRKNNAGLLRRMKGRSDFAAAAARCAEVSDLPALIFFS